MAVADLSTMSSQVEALLGSNPWILYAILLVAVWKLIWYGLAIYKTIQKQQKSWFVVLFVCALLLNDLGILPIIYLILNREKKAIKKK